MMPISTNGHRLKFNLDQGIARITMAGPESQNAIDLGWCHSFAEATNICASDPSVKLVVLQAEGRFFSVGGDIDGFIANRGHLKAHVLQMANMFHTGIMRLYRGQAPVIAAVGGTAAGGGMSLALTADMVLARRSTQFVAAYTRSGLTPDGGLSWFLPRMVGIKRAFEIMSLNEPISAEAAQSLGIVTRVFDDAAFDSGVEEIIGKLSQMSAPALAGLKRLLVQSPTASLAEQFDAEADQVSTIAASPETLAILDAFLARRTKR